MTNNLKSDKMIKGCLTKSIYCGISRDLMISIVACAYCVAVSCVTLMNILVVKLRCDADTIIAHSQPQVKSEVKGATHWNLKLKIKNM
jgi:hypothetical protein